MLFSTPQFIFLFLPVTFTVYFWLNRRRWPRAGKAWLAVASLYFYAHWDVRYLPLLLGSIGFNFLLGRELSARQARQAIHQPSDHADEPAEPCTVTARRLLILGITANLLLLGWYKYANFFVVNLDLLTGWQWTLGKIVLPLGISFFTFTQIAFLVDSFKGKADEPDFLNYVLFVTFFPHLIAGPILHHREMMSQFASRWTLALSHRNIHDGLMMFSIGLFKKVVLADTFAVWADQGFALHASPDFFTAWATALSYTFQLYFDFSGYCDMAIGAALLFNIWLPINFDSPYQAFDIQQFWRRWHMTLSRYLRDYLYIPLGGSRVSRERTLVNLFITFVLGGLWHGASWMFVAWGALHGVALVIHRIWSDGGRRLHAPLAWLVTFLFVVVTWVFFRAEHWNDAVGILSGMVDVRSITRLDTADIPTAWLAWMGPLADRLGVWLPVGLVANGAALFACLLGLLIVPLPNSIQWMRAARTRRGAFLAILLGVIIAIYVSLRSVSPVFLYFNF